MPIQYRVEENPLTTPRSCSIRFVSRGSAGREDIAADIALSHPNFSKEDILTILNAEDEAIMARLLDGEQVTKEGCCTWFPSFTGRLDSPDDPIPPLKDCLHVNVRVSAPFAEDFCQNAQAERVASAEKLPVISSAEDTVLGLRDVLRADGMLRITGSNLAFDRSDPASRCLIEGTRSGSAVQSRIGTISNASTLEAEVAASGSACDTLAVPAGAWVQRVSVSPWANEEKVGRFCAEKKIVGCWECPDFRAPRDYRECGNVNHWIPRLISVFTKSDWPRHLTVLRDEGKGPYLAIKRARKRP